VAPLQRTAAYRRETLDEVRGLSLRQPTRGSYAFSLARAVVTVAAMLVFFAPRCSGGHVMTYCKSCARCEGSRAAASGRKLRTKDRQRPCGCTPSPNGPSLRKTLPGGGFDPVQPHSNRDHGLATSFTANALGRDPFSSIEKALFGPVAPIEKLQTPPRDSSMSGRSSAGFPRQPRDAPHLLLALPVLQKFIECPANDFVAFTCSGF
jgi:hypothetical protein